MPIDETDIEGNALGDIVQYGTLSLICTWFRRLAPDLDRCCVSLKKKDEGKKIHVCSETEENALLLFPPWLILVNWISTVINYYLSLITYIMYNAFDGCSIALPLAPKVCNKFSGCP